MAVTATRIVGPFGADVFFHKGVAAVGYLITGDGVGGALDLGFHKLEGINHVDAPPGYDPTVNNTTKVVAITVPAALGNGKTVVIWLNGKGGH